MDNTNYKKIGQRIELIRNKHGKTKEEVGKICGVSKVAVHKWEAGKGISAGNLIKFCEHFRVSVDEIINGKALQKDELYLKFDQLKTNHEFNYYEEREQILNYLDTLSEYIDYFYANLIPYLNNELGRKDREKFNDYLKHIVIPRKISNPVMMQNLRELISEHQKNDETFEYEVSRYVTFRMPLNPLEILFIPDTKLAKKVLDVLSWGDKCEILMHNLSMIEDGETLESDQVGKMLINSGAQVFYDAKETTWNENLVYLSELGIFKGVKENTRKNIGCQLTLERCSLDEPYRWYDLNFEEVEKLIDEETTKYVSNAILYRDENPLKYFQEQLSKN